MCDEGELIGIHGPKGSGKSTAAAHLVVQHGWHRLSFAQPVKDMARDIAPAPVRWLIDAVGWDRLKQRGPFRRYLQRVGTEGGRNTFGDHVWCDVFAQRANPLLAGGCHVVVDDVRFPNEAQLIHDMGGMMVGIVSHHGRGDAHPSEQVLDSIDVWVDARRTRNAAEFNSEFVAALFPHLFGLAL